MFESATKTLLVKIAAVTLKRVAEPSIEPSTYNSYSIFVVEVYIFEELYNIQFWNVPLPGKYFCSTLFMPPAKSMNII